MKTIQFVILGGKNAEKRILSIKKKNSSFKKAVHLYTCNGYYHTDENTWKFIKSLHDIDVAYVGEIEE